ncbi:YfbM family protein [Kitasatospora sp. NPDC006697]|uniref:YfbM family protein n=1 Tax=Kitasatospora sp. NPDC006697 TaxID=3364020 RepID=UPI0036BD6F88
MSMIGEYARLTPGELARAFQDPQWASEYVHELMETDPQADADPDGPAAGQPRCLDTDKAWGLLHWLLERAGFPLDIVNGEAGLPGADDWGYGPPGYLTPEQVATAAAALAALPGERLVAGVTDAELPAAELYPSSGPSETAEMLRYALEHYRALTGYFAAAARDGHAMLLWIS